MAACIGIVLVGLYMLHCSGVDSVYFQTATSPPFQFHYIHSRAANRICQCTSFTVLQERIHHNRRELDNTSQELLEIHICLASVLSKSDWSLNDRPTFKIATCGGRQQGQTTPEIRTAPQHTTSNYKNIERNGHQPQWAGAG